MLSLFLLSHALATNPNSNDSPKLLHKVELRFPEDAPKGLKGDVTLRVMVDENGKPSKVEIISGPNVFHKEAIRAGYNLEFEPAQKDGTAIPSSIRIHFHFAHGVHGLPASGNIKELVIVSERSDEITTLSKSTIDEKQLEKTSGQQLADTVSQVPGVNTAPSTSGVAKPIIRGQAERRLLLLYDNIRHESQKH